MSEKQAKVVVNVPKQFGLTSEEIRVLKEKFRADVIEILKSKPGDKPHFDEITQVIIVP